MILSELMFLCDENIQEEFVNYLKKLKYNVISVKEINFLGKPDITILDYATQSGRVIVTHDADFGRLIFTSKLSFTGIIYLRPGHIDCNFTISSWTDIEKAELNLVSPFMMVVENNSEIVRIRLRNSLS